MSDLIDINVQSELFSDELQPINEETNVVLENENPSENPYGEEPNVVDNILVPEPNVNIGCDPLTGIEDMIPDNISKLKEMVSNPQIKGYGCTTGCTGNCAGSCNWMCQNSAHNTPI